MSFRDLVALLQIGFAGFAAAMAVLSYRLIRLQVQRAAPNLDVLKGLSSFTKYTLYLSLVVILSTTIDKGFDYIIKRMEYKDLSDSRKAKVTAQSAQSCRESLSGLVSLEGTARSPDRFSEVGRLVHTKCFEVMQSLEALQ